MGMICSFHAATESDRQRFTQNADEFFEFLEESEDTIDLDKSWHAIHFLLTGSAWEGEPPLNFILGGGTPLEDSDGGYGEARFFGNDEVSTISASLSAIPGEELLSRYERKKLAEADIYPSIWDGPGEEAEILDYIRENYAQLLSYLAGLVQKHSAMIVSIQ